MCLLLESIKIQNRTPQNLNWHNRRLNKSRSQLFGVSTAINLRDIIKIPTSLTEEIYKCRIIYSEEIRGVEFVKYTQRNIRSIRLVNGNHIEYEHKYLDRSPIDSLRDGCNADDILIVKNNRITDTSSANVVLFDGKSWFTPSNPLLKGTKRQLLLDSKKIQEEEITLKNLKHFQKIALINAMLDLDSCPLIHVENVLPVEDK
jgi:4-amino-4-deoxychorismate lyase